jgi:AbrB family looped-hinge helix DNA binding protein
MTELVLAKITQKGQMTIPQEIREALEVSTGDYVVLRPLLGGVFLSKATVSPEVRAEDALRHLVTALGKQAEARGIREDADLDAIIEDIQRRAYEER